MCNECATVWDYLRLNKNHSQLLKLQMAKNRRFKTVWNSMKQYGGDGGGRTRVRELFHRGFSKLSFSLNFP